MFLDEVRIPVANRVGAENDGWRVAMVTFSFERGTAFVSELLRHDASSPRTSCGWRRQAGRWDDPSIRRELAIVRRRARRPVGAHQAQRLAGAAPRRRGRRRVGVQARVPPHPGAAAATSPSGPRTGPASPSTTPSTCRPPTTSSSPLYALSLSIAAGTAQIQRNIVGERLLGLPEGALTDGLRPLR